MAMISNLRDCLTFIHIFETKSISNTALLLNRTPSSISKKLAKLEEELQVQLVDRSTNYLEVTPIGHEFYGKCKEIMAKIQECEELLLESNNRISGKLGLSIPELMSNDIFYDCIADFSQQYPDIKLNIQVTNQVVDTSNTQIDFFIRSGELQDSQLIATKLFGTKPVLCASPDYLEQKGQPDSLYAAIKSGDFITPTYVNLNEKFKQLLSHHNVQYQDLVVSHSSDNLDSIIKLVKRGQGMALVPHFFVEKDFERNYLVTVGLDVSFPRIPINLLHRKRALTTRMKTLFKQHISSYFSDYE
jgi:DNA-binding transcriptional LysR family regulator